MEMNAWHDISGMEIGSLQSRIIHQTLFMRQIKQNPVFFEPLERTHEVRQSQGGRVPLHYVLKG